MICVRRTPNSIGRAQARISVCLMRDSTVCERTSKFGEAIVRSSSLVESPCIETEDGLSCRMTQLFKTYAV